MTYADILIFAKTWGMAYLAVLFIVAIVIAFLPGSGTTACKHGDIPLRED